ncbi:MAG TPA: ATP-binding protein, partial [Nitrospira sp.]|nr:ATP-binding protein [Nitrospira sp.]
MSMLLSKEHRITEKGMMEFQPFGKEPNGTMIRDMSGVVILALVSHLEESLGRRDDPDSGRLAVEELVKRLNERVPDRAYRVTAEFLKNPWNSYSNEFGVFLTQFCWDISGDPQFQFNMAREKAISPVIQVLGRPFSVPQIYKMSAYFAQRFGKDSFYTEATQVSNRAAIIQMRFSNRALKQFGPYLRSCAEMYCIAHKGYFSAVPEKFHNLPPANVMDRRCIVNGDEFCEWEVTWSVDKRRAWPSVSWFSRGHDRVAIRQAAVVEQPMGSTNGRSGSHRGETDSIPAGAMLMSKEHRITEKGMMEFQPFGRRPDGGTIHDLSGIVIKADIELLEKVVSSARGPSAGLQAVEELVRRLNERIPNRAYHVTAEALKNPWNGYSTEFVAFLAEFCIAISGEPRFMFEVGRQQAISPIIQVLGRPFSVPQIYKMSAYFSQRFAKDSFLVEAVTVSDRSGILRMTFNERMHQHFGPYRRRCASIWCDAVKGYFVGVPEQFHKLPPAVVKDRLCMAEGDDRCEWEVTWSPREKGGALRRSALSAARRVLQSEIDQKELVMAEQVKVLDARHVELRETYVQQQQLTAELQRRVDQLTTLHESGLVFASILDRETLIENVLDTVTDKLRYDRGLIWLFDHERKVLYGAHVRGLTKETTDFVRSLEISVTDPESLEGKVLLKGEPVLVGDIQQVWDRLHPLNQELARLTKAKSIIAVPLKVKGQVLGSLTVDRAGEEVLTQEDLNFVGTLASQVAIALDNTRAYRQIEELLAGLEAKVRERTAELGEANEKLKELDRLKSEFFANISHEIRTPLTLSIGAFKTLLKSDLRPEANDIVHAGLRNASRLLFLINELLDLAKFDSGRATLTKRCIDLAGLVRSVVTNFDSSPTRRVHMKGLMDSVAVEADAQQMKKVLFNLLSNAFKFSDPKEGQVWIRLASKDQSIELEVEDNGIGMPRDQLGRIFDRFTQLEGGTAKRYEGSGIGLALVKEIVTLHRGTITVESDLGRGSIFTITLPRGNVTRDHVFDAPEDEHDQTLLPLRSEERLEDAPLTPAPSKLNAPLVLVVDDSADMRSYVERILGKEYRIALAKDGADAFEQARRLHPDLIVTDVMMPKMSGHDLLQAVRGDQGLRAVPVIFLTARAGTDARIESLDAGADDYLSKPFDELELLARVGNLIRARAQERELAQLQKEKIARFLPPNLADMILSGEHEDFLKGHRREITVVFVDLRGFTAFVEHTDPEEVMVILREYQTVMGRLVSEYGGTLERFVGDAVMVYFNDPLPCPNHAQQAVKMAIAMRQAISSLQAEWQPRGIQLGAGIGIATGYATIGA